MTSDTKIDITLDDWRFLESIDTQPLSHTAKLTLYASVVVSVTEHVAGTWTRTCRDFHDLTITRYHDRVVMTLDEVDATAPCVASTTLPIARSGAVLLASVEHTAKRWIHDVKQDRLRRGVP